MAKCAFCDKGVSFGIKVSHSHRRSNRAWKPNVKRVKDALMKKEVLCFDEYDVPSFEDPLFEYWVKKYYFELPA